MLRVREAQGIGNLAYRFACAEQPLLGHIHHLHLNVFQCRHTCLLPQQVAQVIWRQTELVGTILHRRLPLASLWGGIPIVEQLLEAGEYVAVYIFAGYELAVIETHAMVEQQFDIVDNQRLAVLVDGMRQFMPYVLHAEQHRCPLAVRKVQRLV